jgi:hypothetical protein
MGLRFIDTLDDATLDAEQKSWAGGADEFQTPTMLPPNVGGQLVNCIVEDNGRPRNRPGADPLGDAVLDAGQRVQALAYFDTPSLEYLYASINLSLRQWTGAAWSTIAAYPFGANSIVDMVQGDDLLYCTSGTGEWFTYSGSAWSAGLGSGAGATGDPPNGATILCWHTNRMFATGAIGSYYDQIYVSFIAGAGANQWNHTDFAFRVGRGEGERIVAMASGRGNWLFVGKEGSIFAVDTDPAATTAAAWFIYRVSKDLGVIGKRAMLMAGSSLWVISSDLALREILPSTVEDTPFEIAPPASEPAKPYFDRINRAAQSKIVLHKYGRYLMAAVPLDAATEPSHVLVWNLRLRAPDGRPAFIGVWTGWTPTVFATTRFAGVERFIIGDSAGYVNEWKDYEDQTEDATYQDNGEDVLCTIRGRSWDFGSQRNPKDAESCELQFVDSTADVDAVAYFDGEEQLRWSLSLEETQNELPLDLPFDLAVLGPTRAPKNMDDLVEFREMYLEIVQTTAGRVELKSMAASAFANTQANE